MASVSLEGVGKAFSGKVHAVRNIDLEIRDRELLVLVGPSGCGKSTTLRMIAGLETPTSGTIRIGERVVNSVAPKDRDIAMVFQNYALYPHMTAYNNMAFGLRLRYGDNWLTRLWLRLTQPQHAKDLAEKRANIDTDVRFAAELLGISHLLDRMPAALSGGERQRVALGRAIVRKPAAFLFDEPLSNLDAQLRTGMRREIRALHSRLQTTMIYVTHDQVEAMTLGDRIVVMKDGEIQQIGPPLEIYDAPANRFVAEFLGSPAMNFVSGSWKIADGTLTFVGGGFCVSASPKSSIADGEPAVMGVRPENLTITADANGRWSIVAIEPLGDSAIIQLRSNDENEPSILTVKTTFRTELRNDDKVTVTLREQAAALWFDPATNENLGF